MSLRYDKNNEFNKKVTNTCFTEDEHSSSDFKVVEKCLGQREMGIDNFGLDQANRVFKYCISRETYIEDNEGETVSVKLPDNKIKCISCIVDNNGNCDSFFSNTNQERSSKGPGCNCTENRTAESRKKKNKFIKSNNKIMNRQQSQPVIQDQTQKAVVTIYPAIEDKYIPPPIQSRSKPLKNTIFKKKK